MGVDVLLITDGRQRLPPSLSGMQHIGIHHLGSPRNRRQLEACQAELSEACSRFRPDIVHFSNAGIAAYACAVPRDHLIVSTVHGNDLSRPWQVWPIGQVKSSIRDGLRRARLNFCVSEHTRRLLSNFDTECKSVVIPNSCDTEVFQSKPDMRASVRASHGLKENIPTVLTVGRAARRKGHELVLQALSSMPQQIQWVVTGEGRRLRWLRFVSKFACPNVDMKLTGWITVEELVALYNSCDVFVLPVREIKEEQGIDSEGFGLAYIEAGACGLPVIGSNVSGCRESIVDGVTGILTPADDPVALAGAIRMLVNDRALAKTMGANGVRHAQSLGGWKRVADRLKAHYETVLSNSN